ncbi:MAG TPA: hypothetical protein VGL97_14450 [Bryobacteraceae bacterium]
MKARFFKFLAVGSRLTKIEYILIAAGIVFATTAVLNGLGKDLNTLFASCAC